MVKATNVSATRSGAVPPSGSPSEGDAPDPDSTVSDGDSTARHGTPSVKSAGRALDILEELAAGGPGSLHTLAGRMKLPKSSLHALLRTMEGRGWIETDLSGSIYRLGIHSLLVGSAYLDGDMVVARSRADDRGAQ